MSNEKLISKFENQEEVHFINESEEMVFRANPKQGFQAKKKGGKPFNVKIGNEYLTDAISEGKLITEKEFINY